MMFYGKNVEIDIFTISFGSMISNNVLTVSVTINKINVGADLIFQIFYFH